MMKISALPYMIADYNDLESACKWYELAPEIGLDGVELMYGYPVPWHLIYRTFEYLQKKKLPVSIVVAHNEFYRLTPQEQKQEVEVIAGYIDLARYFQTNLVRVIVGYWWNETRKETSPKKALAAIIETIKRCLSYAEEKEVILALENHPGTGVSKVILQEIFEHIDSPYLGWNLDTENAYRIDNQTAFDFLEEESIIRRLVHVHLKNFQPDQDGWLPTSLEKGILDVKKMLKIIQSHGYDGWLSLEYAGEKVEDLRDSVSFVRKVWEKFKEELRT